MFECVLSGLKAGRGSRHPLLVPADDDDGSKFTDRESVDEQRGKITEGLTSNARDHS